MNIKSISAEDARKNSASIKSDKETILCDIYRSIENVSKKGGRKIGRQYPKRSVSDVDFSFIICEVKGKGFDITLHESRDPVYIEVTW